MTTTKGINVDVITHYVGSSNMKKAEKDILGLGAAAKSLVGSFAIEQLIQRSFAAFNKENTAVVTLTNSLQNLGISYDALKPVLDQQNTAFENLGFSAASTIGAYTKLTTALGNPAKAMDVMSTAADLARYKQATLEDTAAKMAKAIAGNSRAFTDLGLKIDKSLTPQNAFNKLMDQAKAKVNGLAIAYSKTAAGAMDIFSAKTEDASAKLGAGLAPELQKLAEFATTYLLPLFTILADNIAPITAIAGAIGLVTLAMKGLGIASAIATGEMVLNPIFAGAAAVALIVGKLTQKTAAATNPNPGTSGRGSTGLVRDPNNLAAVLVPKKIADVKKLTAAETLLATLEKQWNAAALKSAQAQTQSAKDKLALERATLSLKLSGSTADMQNIEIQAALQRGQTSEVNNVLLLQRALLNGNADQATILSQEILKANGLAMNVDGVISSLKDAKDPFAGWPTASAAAMAQIKTIQAALDALRNKTITVTVNTVTTSNGGPATSVSTSSSSGSSSSSTTPFVDYIAPIDPAVAAQASIDSIIEYSQAAQERANAMADLLDAQTAIINAALDASAMASQSTSGVAVTSSVPVATAAAIQSGNRYAAQAAAMYGTGDNAVNIVVTASPGIIVDTTQAASTNGTSVIVNRNNPFPL